MVRPPWHLLSFVLLTVHPASGFAHPKIIPETTKGCLRPWTSTCSFRSSFVLSRSPIGFVSFQKGAWAPSGLSSHFPEKGNATDDPDMSISLVSLSRAASAIVDDPDRSVAFSVLLAVGCGTLGQLLACFRISCGLTVWDTPSGVPSAAMAMVWIPALGYPELFGLVGLLIGWLHMLLDSALDAEEVLETRPVAPRKILSSVGFFAMQYFLGCILFELGCNRTALFAIMNFLAGSGYAAFDGTAAGLIASLVTAVVGPLCEVFLISFMNDYGWQYYHYADPGETGFFPLWIVPVYLMGSITLGNVARGIWRATSSEELHTVDFDTIVQTTPETPRSFREEGQTCRPMCRGCNDTRAVRCPTCNTQGYFMTDGTQIECCACNGRGLVICRDCLSFYGDDPLDYKRLQDIMSRMPD